MTHLDEALNRERRRTAEARALARELLGLIVNGEPGHPGEASHRTHWVADRISARWCVATRAWLDDLDPPILTTQENLMDTINDAACDDSGPEPPRLRLHAPVHYVAYGTPRGEFIATCRAATVTGVGGWRTITETTSTASDGTKTRVLTQVRDAEIAALHVTNPTGVFMHECPHDEVNRSGGTWHWPDNCDR